MIGSDHWNGVWLTSISIGPEVDQIEGGDHRACGDLYTLLLNAGHGIHSVSVHPHGFTHL